MMLPGWTEALGWTLLHSFWQGALLGAVYALLRWRLRGNSPQSRYALAVCTLAALLLWPAMTLVQLWPPAGAGPVLQEMGPAAWQAAIAPQPSAASAWQDRLAQALSPLTPWLSIGWLAGVLLLGLRWGGGMHQVRQLRRRDLHPVAPELLRLLASLQKRLGIALPVRLHVSGRIEGPLTLGFFRPVILLPLSLAGSLSPEQWEAILLHELAHIRRADYLANLLQSLAEILLFFHPLGWWLSREIRSEREACCDDLAVAACGSPLRYAEALLRLQQLRFTPQSPFAMSLLSNQGGFSRRIQRLFVAQPSPARPRAALLMALLSLLLLLSQGQLAVQAQTVQVLHAGGSDGEPIHVLITRDMKPEQLAALQARLAEKKVRLDVQVRKTDDQGRIQSLSGSLRLPGGQQAVFSTDNLGLLLIVERPDGGLQVEVLSQDELQPGKPIYLLDDQIISQEEADQLHPGRIAEIDVLKSDSALLLFGEPGAEGVVRITTRIRMSGDSLENISWEEKDVQVRLGGQAGDSLVERVMVFHPAPGEASGKPLRGDLRRIEVEVKADAPLAPSDDLLERVERRVIFIEEDSIRVLAPGDKQVRWVERSTAPGSGDTLVERIIILRPGSEAPQAPESPRAKKSQAAAAAPKPAEPLTVYPNPASRDVQISFHVKGGLYSLAVYDEQGRQVELIERKNYKSGKHLVTWSARGLPAGRYFVSLADAQGNKVQTVQVLIGTNE